MPPTKEEYPAEGLHQPVHYHQQLIHFLDDDPILISNYHSSFTRFIHGHISPKQFNHYCSESLPLHAIPVHNQLILSILRAAVNFTQQPPKIHQLESSIFHLPDHHQDYFSKFDDPNCELEIYNLPIPLPKKRRFNESTESKRIRLRQLAMSLPEDDRERLRRASLALNDHTDPSSTTKRARKRTIKPTPHGQTESHDKIFTAINRISHLQGFGCGPLNGYASFYTNATVTSPILSKSTRYQEYLRLCTTPTCATLKDLPTHANLVDRIKAMCWESGVDGFEESIVDLIQMGLQTYLKTILHAMISLVPDTSTTTTLTLAHLACAVLTEPVIVCASKNVLDRIIPKLWHAQEHDWVVARAQHDAYQRSMNKSKLDKVVGESSLSGSERIPNESV